MTTTATVPKLRTYTNAADGLEAYVTTHRDGFAVSLKDTDAGEFVGLVMIYPTLERADVSAQQAAGIVEAR